MSNFSALKTAIQNAIKQNGNEEITGNLLQNILLSIVETLGDSAINTLETDLSNEATTRGDADTQLNNLITGVKNNVDNGYVYAGIATPSTTPVSGKVFYIALQAGAYTNFGNTAVKQGISILKYNGSSWSNEQVIYTDGGVFDVSAYNGGATYASLKVLLSDANLSTIIPSAVRKGGMSIKFVQSSDNKYVQARCMAQNFTTDVTQWQGVDNEPTAGSENLVKSGGIYSELGYPRETVKVNTSVLDDVNNSLKTAISLQQGDILSIKLIDTNNTCSKVNINLFDSNGERLYSTGHIEDAVNNFYNIELPFDITAFSLNCHSSYRTGNTGNISIAYKTGLYLDLEEANKRIDEANTNISSNSNNIKVVNDSLKMLYYDTEGYKQTVNLSGTSINPGNIVMPISIKQGDAFKVNLIAPGTAYISKVYAYYGSSQEYVECSTDMYGNYIASQDITAITIYVTSISITGQATLEVIKYQSSNNRLTDLEVGNHWKSTTYQVTSGTAISRDNTKLLHKFRTNSYIKVRVNDPSKAFLNVRIVLWNNSNEIYKTYASTSFINNFATIPILQDTGAIAFYANSGEVIGNGNISYEVIFDIDEPDYGNELHTKDILFLRDSIYDLSGPTLGEPITDSSRVGCKVEVSAGDLVIISGENQSGSRRLWGFVDAENNILLAAGSDHYQYVAVNLRLIAPGGSKYFIAQFLRKADKLGAFTVDIYRNGTVEKERALQTKDPLPGYYFDNSYIQNKVARINTLYQACVANGDCFAFITDEHWDDKQMLSKRSPALLHYIEENTKMSKVLDGGDISTQAVNSGFLEYIDCMRRNVNVPFYFSVGNHDGIDESLLAWCYNLKDVKGNLLRSYYYVDEPNKKIRYISLNVFGSDGLDNTQREWVFNEALDVEEGWGIIIYAHAFFLLNAATDAVTLREVTSDFIANLEAYNINPNSKGEIIALFQGHVHRDRIYYTETARIPIISVTCDKYIIYYSSEVADTNVDRIPNTISENSFDVVVLNKTERKLYLVRIGGKARDGVGNEPGDEVEERVVSY